MGLIPDYQSLLGRTRPVHLAMGVLAFIVGAVVGIAVKADGGLSFERRVPVESPKYRPKTGRIEGYLWDSRASQPPASGRISLRCYTDAEHTTMRTCMETGCDPREAGFFFFDEVAPGVEYVVYLRAYDGAEWGNPIRFKVEEGQVVALGQIFLR